MPADNRRQVGGDAIRAVAIAVAAALFVTILAPRAAVAAAPLSALVLLALLWPGGQRLLLGLWRPQTALFALFVLYLAINASWSLGADAYLKVVEVAAVITYSAGAIAALAAQRHPARCEGAIALVAVPAACILAFEVLTDQWLLRGIFNLLPVLRPPDGNHLTVVEGLVVAVEPFELNRNVGALTLLFWPSLLAILSHEQTTWRVVVAIVFVAVSAIAVAFSVHQTSMLALPAGALAFALVQRWPGPARRAIPVLWCLCFIAVVPAALLAARVGLHEAPWLFDSARDRVVIWSHTASLVERSPVLGVGLRSTRQVEGPRAEGLGESDQFVPRTSRHAHNMYLQAWFELGLVGVVLLAAAGLAVLRRLSALPARAQPYAYAQFVSYMVIAGLSWGMWQSWLLGVYAMAALATAALVPVHAAAEGNDEARQRSSSS